MPRLVHITTVADSLGFIEGQIEFLKSRGFDVTVITSPGEKLDEYVRRTGTDAISVVMQRAMTPVADLRSLTSLTDVLLDLEPDIVHAHTPKGGLLGMLAAATACVPVRVYHMRGLLSFTATGWRRQLFQNVERISCGSSHHVIAQSRSLMHHAVDERLVAGAKISVLGGGSNGVDFRDRFNPLSVARSKKSELSIPKTAPVVGFVGRLVGDKGIAELVAAWRIVRQAHPDARLLLVGPFEERDRLNAEVVDAIETDDSIVHVGYTRETPQYYRAMDVVVLPSYREGFPNVPLEASAMKIPVVTTTVPGCTDAVLDGITGVHVPPRNSKLLADAISAYLHDPKLAKKHGEAGRKRVEAEFDPFVIWEKNLELYHRLLEQNARRR